MKDPFESFAGVVGAIIIIFTVIHTLLAHVPALASLPVLGGQKTTRMRTPSRTLSCGLSQTPEIFNCCTTRRMLRTRLFTLFPFSASFPIILLLMAFTVGSTGSNILNHPLVLPNFARPSIGSF